LEPTAWGKLQGGVYKWPVMLMDVAHDDQSVETFRLVPAAAAAGFLLSPHIQYGSRWVDFATAGMQGEPDSPTTPQDADKLFPDRTVRGIRIYQYGNEGDTQAYESQIKVKYWRFDFQPQILLRQQK